MNITLEQIDTLRERANISYVEAKKALEKCNGDLVEALVYVEKNNKMRTVEKNNGVNNFFNVIGNIISKGNKMKFIIRNKEINLLNIPVTLAIIIGVFTMPISLFLLLAALFTNHRITIKNNNGNVYEVNDVFDNIKGSVNIKKDEVKEEVDIPDDLE